MTRLTDVWALLNAGKTKSEAARILGISRQRVHELVGKSVPFKAARLDPGRAAQMGRRSGQVRRKKKEWEE